MHKHPIAGVTGAKPRVPGAGGNGKPTKEELGALNREYLNSRNRSQAAKAESAEIALMERKGTLVPRRMVALQCAFLLSAFRQRVQSEPTQLARQLVLGGHLEETHQHGAQELIKGALCAMLHELANLPARLADPNWAAQIDDDLLVRVDGVEAGEPRTPQEAKARAAKARGRAARKLETQRVRRAERV